jgi:CheY-like chemotaxis protein
MITVLVVDDSTVDRRLVGGLLAKDGDFQIEYAANGEDAILRMQRSVPDLVVTDLIMPEMDGLKLVATVRNTHPLVPVILMTSKGSEDVAVQALQLGAASYVPKRLLAQDLLGTAHRVLAASRGQRSQSRLMGCMVKSQCAFVLENDCTLIPPLVTFLQEAVTQAGLCGQADCTRVGIALEESLVNALYHGNLGIGSELRDKDHAAYCALVARRCNESPYQDRHIYLEANLTRLEAVFVIRDEGEGFDPAALPDATDPANLEEVSGRGVLLMRTFMDEVAFNEVGNQVTLTRRRG